MASREGKMQPASFEEGHHGLEREQHCRLAAGGWHVFNHRPGVCAVDGRVGYSWRMWSADGRIDKAQPETFETIPLDLFGPPPTVSRNDLVDLTQPAQTSADVSLSGKVDLLGRGLGVSASAHAKVNPYDPDSETLDPILVSAEVAVESSFVDRVVMLDPTLLPGAPHRLQGAAAANDRQDGRAR